LNSHISQKRYLANFSSSRDPVIKTDVLVIGSGVAGLTAAYTCAESGLDVIVATKDEMKESNTEHAQGGVAVVMNDGDTFEKHIVDTVAAGDGLCNRETVEIVVKEGPERIRDLIKLGLKPDKKGPKIDFALEGGHSFPRIIHFNGDETGHSIEALLCSAVRKQKKTQVFEYTFVIDLITADNRCFGALVWDSRKKRKKIIQAGATVVATGGAGSLYRETTNPAVATADGVAFAYRAGAEIADMEFIQFHPTTLYIAGASRSLISETVRGEGAVLRDKNGVHFMPNYHPRGDLAPRDVVSRAIVNQMRLTGDTNVYLDLTHLDANKVRKRFPYLRQLCLTFDLDISKDYIPVRPSAHYMIGGIRVDTLGRTAVRGLYCAGEAGASGLHGANRLGSNSLLEGLVFGYRAARDIAGAIRRKSRAGRWRGSSRPRYPVGAPINFSDVENSLRSLLWRHAGIERNAELLSQAIGRINFWCNYIMDKEFNVREGWLLQNALTVALMICRCALSREETRGSHIRTDFPDKDDRKWKRHNVLRRA